MTNTACDTLAELAERIKGSRVFIQTHNFPDQDALASACGLQRILAKFGINANLCYQGTIDNIAMKHILEEYNIPIQEFSEIDDMVFDDKIILVDGQKFNANMTDLPGDEIACIDHHPANDFSDYLFQDIRKCGACASIITDYFKKLNVPLDREIATILLYGIQMDTEYLRRGVTSLDIAAYQQLFNLADEGMLKQLAGKAMQTEDLRAFGTAIETLTVGNRIGVVRIPFHCEDYQIAQIADFMLSLAEVDHAIVYSKRPGGLKFSMRTQLDNVHCGNVLRECLEREGGGGGGHPHMAGGFLPRDKVPTLYNDQLGWEAKKRNSTEFRDHLIERFSQVIKNMG